MGYDQEKRAKVLSTPQSGARRPAGKTDSCDEALRSGSLPKSEEVTTLPVESDNNKCYEAMETQNDGNVLIITQKQEKAIAETRKAVNKKSL